MLGDFYKTKYVFKPEMIMDLLQKTDKTMLILSYPPGSVYSSQCINPIFHASNI